MKSDGIDLEELYEEYFPKIYNFFFYRLLHRENAEDLTEQTFLKIAEHLHSYQAEKAKISTWIWRISENTLIDFYRTRKHSFSLDDEEQDFSEHFSISFEEQYRKIANPEGKRLYEALARLPERDRTLIFCKYFLDLSYHEISEKYQLNESTLASILQRAKGKLRRVLEEEPS